VTFVNRDPFAHNVSAYGWGWYDDLGEGQAFRATFREPGIYPFACTIHPGMTGAIVVGNGTGVGSSERVDVAPVVLAPQDAGPPAGSTPSVVPLASESVTDTSTAGWWIGGALGFALGVGSAVATRARRLWRAARSRPAGAAT
jgi:hypothetical protein